MRPWIHFNEDDGLPGNNVTDLTRDSTGFLWIATMSGVSKFDGDRFIPINDTNGNPLPMVRAIVTGQNGTIYAGMFGGGLAIIKDDTVRKVIHAPHKKQDLIRKLYYSKYHQTLLAGSDHGLLILRDSILVQIPFREINSLKSEVLSFTSHDSVIFFAVADEGIYRFVLSRNRQIISTPEKISKGMGFACLYSGNTLYASNYDSIFTISITRPYKQSFLSRTSGGIFLWNFSRYKDGKFLAGGIGDERFKGAAGIYDPSAKTFTSFTEERSVETVNAIFHDSIAGVTWIARDDGLTAMFDSPFRFFILGGNNFIKDTGFKGDSLFILTGEGVSCFSEGKIMPLISEQKILRTINRFFEEYHRLSVFDNYGFPETVSFVESAGKLFVATQRGAISVPDLKTYIPFAVGTFMLSGENSAYAFVRYNDLKFYPSLKEPQKWIVPDGPGGRVTDITEMNEAGGIIYCISPLKGLYAIRNNTVFNRHDAAFLTDIADMDRDNLGNLWILTSAGKLSRVVFKDSLYLDARIDLSRAGINGNSFKWIRFNGNYLVTGTNKGLYYFSHKDILAGNPFLKYFFNGNNGYDFVSAGSPVADKKGNIYVNTRNHIVQIDTCLPERARPVMYISDVIINGKKFNTAAIEKQTLKFDKKQISFRFATIRYPLSRNIRYRYSVNSSTWVDGNHVELQSLRPGRYEILLESFSRADLAVELRTIRFNIRPPFTRSGWFFTMIFIISGSLVYLLVRMRIDTLRKRHREKELLLKRNAELQLRSLQIQMNPHFIFNSLNAIQGFIISKDTEESLNFLSKLASIIRSNLENASEEYIPLTNEISFLEKYISIESMRFGDSLRIELVNNVGGKNVSLPPMLIQPLIENAIQHGFREGVEGRIRISFDCHEDILRVTVEDNGPGMEATKQQSNTGHNGRALKIITQRIAILNQMNNTDCNSIAFMDIIDNDLPAGTRVILNLKIDPLSGSPDNTLPLKSDYSSI